MTKTEKIGTTKTGRKGKQKSAKQFREVSGSNLSNENYSKNKYILLISY